jgi:hypothetical protein
MDAAMQPIYMPGPGWKTGSCVYGKVLF